MKILFLQIRPNVHPWHILGGEHERRCQHFPWSWNDPIPAQAIPQVPLIVRAAFCPGLGFCNCGSQPYGGLHQLRYLSLTFVVSQVRKQYTYLQVKSNYQGISSFVSIHFPASCQRQQP